MAIMGKDERSALIDPLVNNPAATTRIKRPSLIILIYSHLQRSAQMAVTCTRSDSAQKPLNIQIMAKNGPHNGGPFLLIAGVKTSYLSHWRNIGWFAARMASM